MLQKLRSIVLYATFNTISIVSAHADTKSKSADFSEMVMGYKAIFVAGFTAMTAIIILIRNLLTIKKLSEPLGDDKKYIIKPTWDQIREIERRHRETDRVDSSPFCENDEAIESPWFLSEIHKNIRIIIVNTAVLLIVMSNFVIIKFFTYWWLSVFSTLAITVIAYIAISLIKKKELQAHKSNIKLILSRMEMK